MQINFRQLLVTSVLLHFGCGATSSTPVESASPPIPVLQPTDTAWSTITHHRVTVIDFWATWCGPCAKTIPKLEQLYKTHKHEDLSVVGINVGEHRDRVHEFVREARISYPMYLDPDFRNADRLGARVLPTLLIFDHRGREVHRTTELDKRALLVIKNLLREPN